MWGHSCVHPEVDENGDRIATHDCWCSVDHDHQHGDYRDD